MVEVDWIGCEVGAVVYGREHHLEDAPRAERCLVITVDIAGDGVRVWGLMSASPLREMLGHRESGRRS